MFGKKTSKPKSREGAKPRNNDLSNMMGLGVPMEHDDDDDDNDLLAELAALEGRPVGKQNKKKSKQALVSMDEIDKMTAAGMKDIDDDNFDDDDDDFDESDLLAELEGLSGDDDDDNDDGGNMETDDHSSGSQIKELLNERKVMYTKAIENAKAEGASSKVRRLDRGLKEIINLSKKADKGNAVSEDEIPPPVVVKGSASKVDAQSPPSASQISDIPVQPVIMPSPPKPVMPSPPKPALRPEQPVSPPKQPTPPPKPSPPKLEKPPKTNNSNKITLLLERQKEFKIAALAMKKKGDIEAARTYLATSKQFDAVIEAAKSGEEVDLSDMPEASNLGNTSSQPKTEAPTAPAVASSITTEVALSSTAEATSAPSGPPPVPTTIMEALQQRLEKYQETALKAKEEGNGSKARRLGRIVKQYQDTIKDYKLKKPIDYSELPAPPGYDPIPGISAAPAQSNNPPVTQTPLKQASAAAAMASTSAPTVSRNEQHYEFLVNRQKEFKVAALEAKKSGDVETAREYLRQAKGLDQMIAAAESGVRVDITTVPSVKKRAQAGQAGGADSSHKEEVVLTGSTAENYLYLESALRKQIEASETNTQHYKLLGNLDAAKNFESLLNSSKKDLTTLLHYKKQGAGVPKCNYLLKTFPVIKSNPQLSDSELEITIVRCVNVPLPSGWQPKDMHVYVTYEFPFPQEKPQVGNTMTKKETINPEFNESFKVSIDRKNRAFSRVCKRQTLNVKVHHVRGFLKNDRALAQASFKLESFSSKCEIHESLDLMDLERGRKSVGGKIEVMIKIREPLVDKDAEIIKEKWLVLDTHLRRLEMKTSHRPQPQPTTSTTYESLEVWKSEKDACERQISAYKAQGKQAPANVVTKMQSCQQSMQTIQNKLKQGGKKAINDYLTNLVRGLEIEKTKAQNALRINDKDAAKVCLARKKLIEKEVGILKQRLGL